MIRRYLKRIITEILEERGIVPNKEKMFWEEKMFIGWAGEDIGRFQAVEFRTNGSGDTLVYRVRDSHPE